jgi:hypothetical protein
VFKNSIAIKGLTVFFVLGGLVFAAEGKGASATKPKQEKTFYISVMWGQIDGKNSLELAEKVDANNAKIKKTIEALRLKPKDDFRFSYSINKDHGSVALTAFAGTSGIFYSDEIDTCGKILPHFDSVNYTNLLCDDYGVKY